MTDQDIACAQIEKLVAHTERSDNIRIISARKATRNEEEYYQEAG